MAFQIKPKIKRFVWLCLTILVVFGADWAIHAGISIPFPFILILASVILAGAFGGLIVGTLAGLVGALQILHAFSVGIGPEELTGSLFSTLLGAVVYVLVGAQLGFQKDRNDRLVSDLRKTQQKLESAVEKTEVERDSEAEKVLQTGNRLRHAMKLAGIGYFEWDVKTANCEICSDEHAAHFGLTPHEYQTSTRGPTAYGGFVVEEDREKFITANRRVDDGETVPFDYRIRRPDGEIRFIRQISQPTFNDDGQIVKVIGSTIDLTELHEAEDRLRKAQRIEIIGNLTGGVAHDFNNLLAIVLGNLELALMTDEPKLRQELLEEAIKATNRGAALTKNLLSFARRAQLSPTRINLNDVVRSTVKWSSRVLPMSLNIQTSLPKGLWDTELDAVSVESAVINLLVNARDAMPEGGKIMVETQNLRIGQEYIDARFEDIEPGRYVMLAISDTGEGIAADKLERIFEPFYSEKPVGEGTGLGLSMVQGFVKQSKGAVRVYSEVGVGTTFKLFLKAAGEETEADVLDEVEQLGVQQQAARILMAEDELDLSRILQSMLESAGHTVTVALTGDDALETFKNSGPFDIVMTDIVMPGVLQGPSLASEIRKISPDTPCIFLSGYAAEATVHGNGLKPSDIRLMKPISRLPLLAAISDALSSDSDRSNNRSS